MKSLTYNNVTFPPTIKEYDLPDNIFDFDSYNSWIYYYFLLEDYTLKSGKIVFKGTIYIGAHGSDKKKVYFDGSYWHSSENDEFNEIFFNELKAVLKFVIKPENLLNTGWIGAKNKEERIIRNAKKEKPNMVFNISNGIKEYNTMDIDGLQSLAKQVREQQEGGKKHFPENVVEVKDQNKENGVTKAQPRRHEHDAIKQITLQVSNHGPSKAKKLVKWMNWNGTDLIVDKSTTLKVFKSAKVPHITQIEIPSEITKNWNIGEAKYFGLLCNASEEENPLIEKNTNVDDASKLLVDNYFYLGWDKDDKTLRGHKEINQWLEPFHLGSYGKKSAIDKAENLILKGGPDSAGKGEKDWSLDEYQPELYEKIKYYRQKNPHLLVITLSSGNMSSWYEECDKQMFSASEGKYKKLAKVTSKKASKAWKWVYDTDKRINFNKITGVCIIVNHGKSYTMKDEFNNGKKDKKGTYNGNSNWKNFSNWKTMSSKYTVEYKELDMEQLSTDFTMAAE